MHLLAKSSWGSYLYSLVASTPDLFSKRVNLFVLKEINFVFKNVNSVLKEAAKQLLKY